MVNVWPVCDGASKAKMFPYFFSFSEYSSLSIHVNFHALFRAMQPGKLALLLKELSSAIPPPPAALLAASPLATFLDGGEDGGDDGDGGDGLDDVGLITGEIAVEDAIR